MAFGHIDDWICECADCGEQCIGRTPQQARKLWREHRAECPDAIEADRTICDHGSYYVSDDGDRVCLACGHVTDSTNRSEETR